MTTNEIMKLAEVYAWHSVHGAQTNGECVMEARAALEEAVQAQADEIERLTEESAMHSRVAQKAIDDVVELKAKLDAMDEGMLEADWSIDSLEKAEREIERLTSQCKLFKADAYKAQVDAQTLVDAATKVPLNIDVLNSLWGDAVAVGDPTAGNLHIRYARAVEAHHNIKGTTP